MEEGASQVKGKFRLGSDAIKYIAVLAMLIDHIAWCFVDTNSLLGQIMHVIGRIAAPIMCYFIAEGYHYTRDLKRYLLRLFIFAFISWAPFVYMETGEFIIGFDGGNITIRQSQGVIFTFFLGLSALAVIHEEKIPALLRCAFVFFLCYLSLIGDWMFIAVVWIILFDRFRGDFKKQMAAFAVSGIILEAFAVAFLSGDTIKNNLFQLGFLLAIIPLYFYSGEKGRSGNFSKWFFYLFYPLHMLVLGLIKYHK